MANTKDLKIKGSITVTAPGVINLSVYKINNFADKVTIIMIDESGNTEDASATGLRVYTTGKEPTNPILSYSNAGLAMDENWTFIVAFSSTDDTEQLTFSFNAFMLSNEEISFTFDNTLKVAKAR